MSSQFIGLTMLVTLSSPPGAQLRGVVSSIEPRKSLTLRNVTCPANGKYVPEFTINAAEILELVEAGNENAVTAAPPPAISVTVPKAKPFEDPAILSMGKRPAQPSFNTLTPASARGEWTSPAMERKESSRTVTAREDRVLSDITQVSTMVENITITDTIEDVVEHLVLEEPDAEVSTGNPVTKPGRRTRRRKGQTRRGPEDSTQELDVTPAKETTKSKGWRQTPLLEPNPSFQPFSTLKKKARGKGRVDENGWATEDATDVQDMGDFDFAGSLAKFDKHTVFTQIQAEDEVADEDRLVAHNRLPKPKPGTAGGKNLHYTENVLDSQNGAAKTLRDVWKSEAGDSDEDDRASHKDTESGRQSRRGESRLATNRKPISRKGSYIVSSVTNSQVPRVVPVTTTPSTKPSFYLIPSDRRCEPISALQMLNLENIADNELGLTEDMMSENAGRGIAEVALSALDTGGRGLTRSNSIIIPVVVVFAGNNKSGLRAVAAGRHLRNRGLNVVLCVLGLERETELLVGLKRQLKVYRSFGGKVFNKVELLEHIKTLNTPIELIIDGLLGLTIPFEELRIGDQATAYELIEWANRSQAAVLAIDIPTGIDPTTGKINIIDGRQLYIHSKYVVAMGGPKKGLLEAMCLGEGVADEEDDGKGGQWQLFVADVGLGAAVWKKAGTRVRRGVEFEGSWVLGMRFQGAVD